jgi:predicted YcjX-like family ATPase
MRLRVWRKPARAVSERQLAVKWQSKGLRLGLVAISPGHLVIST